MLKPGFSVTSPRGTIVDILENTPERFAVKRILPPNTGRTPSHRHDDVTERFRVLEGEVTASIGETVRLLREDDVMAVPAGSAHVHPHTDSSTIATLEQAIEPRPRFVSVFYASWLTWLGEGRVDEQDEPTLLEAVAILRAGGAGTWLSGVPVAVQRALVPVLAGVARARRIRPVVPPGI